MSLSHPSAYGGVNDNVYIPYPVCPQVDKMLKSVHGRALEITPGVFEILL